MNMIKMKNKNRMRIIAITILSIIVIAFVAATEGPLAVMMKPFTPEEIPANVGHL